MKCSYGAISSVTANKYALIVLWASLVENHTRNGEQMSSLLVTQHPATYTRCYFQMVPVWSGAGKHFQS